MPMSPHVSSFYRWLPKKNRQRKREGERDRVRQTDRQTEKEKCRNRQIGGSTKCNKDKLCH